jgi:asparagine synthase (glutamine-hydrolysing)
MTPVIGVLQGGSLTPAGGRPAGDPTLRHPLCQLEGTIFDLDRLAAKLGARAIEPESIVLAGYERWGEEMLGHLRGNFALAIHDPAKRTALLACDQLGARSLFIHRAGSRLTFATEIRDLLRLLPTRPAPDEASLVGWLAGASTQGDGTLYEGVERLPGGTLLRVSDSGVEARRYWAPSYSQPISLARDEAAAAAREMLAAAIRRQVPDDRACGVLLSGGLDSSSVAALSCERAGRGNSPRAYSALFPDHSSIDESELIDAVVSDLGLAHSSVTVHGGSMIGGSLEYLREWELPAPSPNHFLWRPLLRRAAADGVAVMLDGEGGDELWKFSPYLLADRLRAGRALSTMRLARDMVGTDRYDGWRSLIPYLRFYAFKGATPSSLHRAVRRSHAPSRYAPAWLSGRSAEILVDRDDPWAWKRLGGPRWWAYMADLLTSTRVRLGVGDYLRHRAAMAGLEDRHPLMDLDLVEFALSLPPTLAVDPHRERPLLRDAMAGSIPDSVRLRPGKSYFTALFGDCLAERDISLVRGLLTDDAEVGRYLDLEMVQRRLLDDPSPGRQGNPAWAWPIWRLVTAECWLRAQEDDGFAAGLLSECTGREDDWALSPSP